MAQTVRDASIEGVLQLDESKASTT